MSGFKKKKKLLNTTQIDFISFIPLKYILIFFLQYFFKVHCRSIAFQKVTMTLTWMLSSVATQRHSQDHEHPERHPIIPAQLHLVRQTKSDSHLNR